MGNGLVVRLEISKRLYDSFVVKVFMRLYASFGCSMPRKTFLELATFWYFYSICIIIMCIPNTSISVIYLACYFAVVCA